MVTVTAESAGSTNADGASAFAACPLTRTISRALQWHYSDALGVSAEMARGGAPPAPALLLQIAAGACYSGRGRRPAAATPSARLFSDHH